MKLHLDKTLFRQAIQFTADQMRIPAVYIEKDYWVTYVLRAIFSHEIGKESVFKGGTSLSKCYKMIERFSEDIDLVVLRREGESNNRLTSKIRKISAVVSEVLPEIEIAGLTQKMGMNRKTAHTYTKEYQGIYGQVRDVIVVEATCLGYFEPYTTIMVNSFIGDTMLENGQKDLAETYGMLPFELLALDPTRTICEKIMSLVRFSYSENPIDDLKKKIRHTFDLHQLLQQSELSIFFDSIAFEEMLLKVANDDVASYKNANEWLVHHPTDALLFKDVEHVWKELSVVYNVDFRKLVYGELPNEAAILISLKRIKERLSSIRWTIQIQIRMKFKYKKLEKVFTVLLFFCFCLLVVSGSLIAQKDSAIHYSLTTYLHQFHDLSAMPRYADQVYDAEVSTYDRTGMNNDGFNGTYSFLRRNIDSSLVIFDQKGPGVINRIWTPTPTEDTLDFFIDDTLRPAFSLRYIDLFTGRVFPFVAPLCANQLGGYYCYLPIPFQQACKIVLRAKTTRFHQIGYQLYPAGTIVKSFSPNLDATEKSALQQLTNTWNKQHLHAADFFPGTPAKEFVQLVKLRPGAAATIFQSNSPGRILGFELQAPVRLDTIAKSIDLKITWDGDSQPAVYCPLADYFGYAFGEASMQGLVIGSNGKRFYSFFPMPFDRSAKIELIYRNSGRPDAPPELTITGKFLVSNQPRNPQQEGKFYARWNRENPVAAGQPFTMLDVKGKGHFAGVNLQAQGLGTGITSFFEGDDSTIVDGELRMHGTGSEDFFNGGWYALLDCWDDGMSLPLSGALDYSIPLCRTGGYRFFLTDKISFRESFLQTMEHGPEYNLVPADYTSVSYFYCSRNNPQVLKPSIANTKIYVPDTLEIYPQLTLAAMDESLAVEAKWDGTPAKSMYYKVTENSLLKFSLQDIPFGLYEVYLDYQVGKAGVEFSLWQRQTQLSAWTSTYAPAMAKSNMQKLAMINLSELNHSLSFRFKTTAGRNQFILGRLVLVRK